MVMVSESLNLNLAFSTTTASTTTSPFSYGKFGHTRNGYINVNNCIHKKLTIINLSKGIILLTFGQG